jgi:phosphoglycolate phosphatase-like HAD superfamily hydrolase
MHIGFDFDGTLLDSRNRHVLTLRHVWPEVDKALGDNWVGRFWEQKLNGASTKAFLKSEGVQAADALAGDWVRHIEDEHMLDDDVLYPFALQIINDLSVDNDLYLVTARGNREGAQRQMRRYGLADAFKYMGVVDPGAGAGLRKAKLLPVPTLDVVVGDTESDAEWARSCSARFVPVCWGFRSSGYWMKTAYNAVTAPDHLFLTITQ